MDKALTKEEKLGSLLATSTIVEFVGLLLSSSLHATNAIVDMSNNDKNNNLNFFIAFEF